MSAAGCHCFDLCDVYISACYFVKKERVGGGGGSEKVGGGVYCGY